MDGLPLSLAGVIAQPLSRQCHGADVARDAASCALVGHALLSLIADSLWDSLEPGCVQRAEEAFRRATEVIDFGPAPSVPTDVTPDSRADALKARCKELGARRCSGTKAQLWSAIEAKVSADAARHADDVARQERRLALAPTKRSACPLGPTTRALVRVDINDRICASRARGQYGLTDGDLQRLPCTLTRNPHYRTAAPMRLYMLTDVIQASAGRAPAAPSSRDGLKERRRERLRAALQDHDAAALSWSARMTDLKHAFVVSGGQGRLEACVSAAAGIESRYRELVAALEERGVCLRRDSRLCAAFIDGGHGSAVEVAETMREMHFFYTHTDYASIVEAQMDEMVRDARADGERLRREDFEDMRHGASESAKGMALSAWARTFHDGRDAIASPVLPPRLALDVASSAVTAAARRKIDRCLRAPGQPPLTEGLWREITASLLSAAVRPIHHVSGFEAALVDMEAALDARLPGMAETVAVLQGKLDAVRGRTKRSLEGWTVAKLTHWGSDRAAQGGLHAVLTADACWRCPMCPRECGTPHAVAQHAMHVHGVALATT